MEDFLRRYSVVRSSRHTKAPSVGGGEEQLHYHSEEGSVAPVSSPSLTHPLEDVLRGTSHEEHSTYYPPSSSSSPASSSGSESTSSSSPSSSMSVTPFSTPPIGYSPLLSDSGGSHALYSSSSPSVSAPSSSSIPTYDSALSSSSSALLPASATPSSSATAPSSVFSSSMERKEKTSQGRHHLRERNEEEECERGRAERGLGISSFDGKKTVRERGAAKNNKPVDGGDDDGRYDSEEKEVAERDEGEEEAEEEEQRKEARRLSTAISRRSRSPSREPQHLIQQQRPQQQERPQSKRLSLRRLSRAIVPRSPKAATPLKSSRRCSIELNNNETTSSSNNSSRKASRRPSRQPSSRFVRPGGTTSNSSRRPSRMVSRRCSVIGEPSTVPIMSDDEADHETEEEETEEEEGNGGGMYHLGFEKEREWTGKFYSEDDDGMDSSGEIERRRSSGSYLGVGGVGETLNYVLNGDANQKLYKKKKYRNKEKLNRSLTTLWRILLWRFSMISFFPFIPLCLCLLLLNGLALLFLLSFNEKEMADVKLYWWFFWLAYSIGSFMLIQFLLSLCRILTKKILYAFAPSNIIYVYIKPIYYHVGGSIWAILQISTYKGQKGLFLSDVSDTGDFWLNNIFTSLIITYTTYIFLLILIRYLISKLNRNIFWDSISEYLFKERALYNLSSSRRREKLIMKQQRSQTGPNKDTEEARQLSAFQFSKAWKYLLKTHHKGAATKVSLGLGKHAVDVVPEDYIGSISDAIFKNLDHEQKGFFQLSDVELLYGEGAKSQKIFSLFDKANKQKVDRAATKVAVMEILSERNSLYKSLRDREGVSQVLSRVLKTVFWIAMTVIVLFIFGATFDSLLIPFSSVFLGLSFVFGNSLKNVWESILVIFVNQPFEAGDRVNLGHSHDLIISHVYLLTTEAYAPDGRQFLIPNAFLFNREITQMQRSEDARVFLSFSVDFRTKKRKLTLFKDLLIKWLKQDDSPWDLNETLVWIGDTTDINKINISIWIHLIGINWKNPSLYIAPRSKLWYAVQHICMDLNIRFYAPTMRVKIQQQDTSGATLPQPQMLPTASSIASLLPSDKFLVNNGANGNGGSNSVVGNEVMLCDVGSNTTTDVGAEEDDDEDEADGEEQKKEERRRRRRRRRMMRLMMMPPPQRTATTNMMLDDDEDDEDYVEEEEEDAKRQRAQLAKEAEKEGFSESEVEAWKDEDDTDREVQVQSSEHYTLNEEEGMNGSHLAAMLESIHQEEEEEEEEEEETTDDSEEGEQDSEEEEEEERGKKKKDRGIVGSILRRKRSNQMKRRKKIKKKDTSK
ncbi:hypothetical protein QOT17_000852 [Balamuthia mandrillaris]